MNIKLEKGVALVLVGPQGSGKTMLAKKIAEGYGAYSMCTAFDMISPFQLGAILVTNPKTVILELDETPTSEYLRHYLKPWTASPTIRVDRPMVPPVLLATPHLIICTQGAWLENRRFNVINVGALKRETQENS
jgi:hypothetical protein